MTQSVDTDTRFPEFGSLAEWSIAESPGAQGRCHVDEIPNAVPVPP